MLLLLWEPRPPAPAATAPSPATASAPCSAPEWATVLPPLQLPLQLLPPLQLPPRLGCPSQGLVADGGTDDGGAAGHGESLAIASPVMAMGWRPI